MGRLASVVLLSLVLLPACSNRVQQDQKQTDDADAARRQREAYQAQAEEKLHELDQKIEDLKSRINQNTPDKEDLDQQMAELERRRAIAHEKLEKLKTSSQGAWSDMKAGIDAAVADLDTAYHEAANRFK
jgi:peptidoglycan hydrolase CwlO-like protein